MTRVLMPLPDRDYDTTEVAVPWRVLRDQGFEVVFATEAGAVAETDPLLLSGVLFGQLGAAPEVKAIYAEMIADPAYRAPLRWDDLRVEDHDALWLTGGHAPGMKQYLESEPLRAFVRAFWESGRPVAAICHGPIVLARAGLLSGRRTACLPRSMELLAWSITAWKLGSYYRTYPETVEDEVRRSGGRVDTGPLNLGWRGTETNDAGTFLVEDGDYLSARWPGDAWRLARAFAAKLGGAAA